MARTQKKVKAKHNRTKKGKQHKKTQKKGVGVYTGNGYVKSRSPRSRRGNESNRRRSPLRSIRSRSRSRGNERYRSRSRRSRSRSPPRRRLNYMYEVTELNNMIKRKYGRFLPQGFNYYYEKRKFDNTRKSADDLYRELRPTFDIITKLVSPDKTLVDAIAEQILFQAGTRNYNINLFDGENLTIEQLVRGGKEWLGSIKESTYNVFFSHMQTRTGRIFKNICSLQPNRGECLISQTQNFEGVPTLSHEIPEKYTAFMVIEIGLRGEADDIFLVALELRLKELIKEKSGFTPTVTIHTNDKYRWRYPPPPKPAPYLGGY